MKNEYNLSEKIQKRRKTPKLVDRLYDICYSINADFSCTTSKHTFSTQTNAVDLKTQMGTLFTCSVSLSDQLVLVGSIYNKQEHENKLFVGHTR